MRQKLLVNDIHLGVTRSGGTTPKSAGLLKEWLLTQLHGLLMAHTDKDVIINGDLFDAFAVPMLDALGFYIVACEWLDASKVESRVIGQLPDSPRLILVEGNHDWSKDNAKLSSFAFVARVLQAQYGDRVVVVSGEPKMVDEGLYIIPHMANQSLFDLALKSAEGLRDTLILLHANYDNKFALESDASLNVTAEWCNMTVAYGNQLVFGHEHIGRRPAPGVLIAGNHFPSSVSDCLGNSKKSAHVLSYAHS